jgi:hypothetical protein
MRPGGRVQYSNNRVQEIVSGTGVAYFSSSPQGMPFKRNGFEGTVASPKVHSMSGGQDLHVTDHNTPYCLFTLLIGRKKTSASYQGRVASSRC